MRSKLQPGPKRGNAIIVKHTSISMLTSLTAILFLILADNLKTTRTRANVRVA